MRPRLTVGLLLATAGFVAVAAFRSSSPADTAAVPASGVAAAAGRSVGATGTRADSMVGVFEGRTPCGTVATTFTGFPAQNCEKIKWSLTLHRDAGSGAPTTWVYRGTRTERRGRWTSERGAGPERRWTVYHLQDDRDTRVLSLLRVDENVLLILDRTLVVLVGDASWSYTLNRTDRATR